MSQSISFTLLQTTEDLTQVCRQVAEAPYLAIDTEFMRDVTYWPKLCLVQFASPDAVYLADPLAPTLSLEPFYQLLRDSPAPKIFHAARQDVEIFYYEAGFIPAPLFDTQVAAMACGFGESVGYDTLVRKVARASIDKSSRASDWSRRPLSDKQLRYAAQDVFYLRDIYVHLERVLKAQNRLHWLEEEMAGLTSVDTYDLKPENAWKRLKIRTNVRKHLGVLMEVAAWREREAQARNLPRGRILKDDALYEIVAHRPTSLEALTEGRYLPKSLARSPSAPALIEAVTRGMAIPKDQLPLAPHAGQPQTEISGLMVDLLKVALKLQCERFNVAQKLVATVADLEKIAASDTLDLPVLHGWRREVFGEIALKLKRGKLAIGFREGQIDFVPLKDGGSTEG